ncbi:MULTISPECIES: hypothetical protein [unclassified Xanthobacter]|uniref:hypothetical protein n=1 Tax=unclassified Xanthobacter TaxID=2623496 RepID=UPI001F3D9E08|nr:MULTISPECIES: hypothetical protein [unclassified Xanthobacter]
MVLALKFKDVDCYISDRVFDNVRVKDGEAAARHVNRLKRLLQHGPAPAGNNAKPAETGEVTNGTSR